MEIVARRDAFKSGFEVILFAPGCAKKEDSNDGGGRIRSEKKRSAFFTLRNSPCDARVIRTCERIFLFLPFLPFFIKEKGSFSPKLCVLNEPARNYERSFPDTFIPSCPSKVSVRILFEWINRHCTVKHVISFFFTLIIIRELEFTLRYSFAIKNSDFISLYKYHAQLVLYASTQNFSPCH